MAAIVGKADLDVPQVWCSKSRLQDATGDIRRELKVAAFPLGLARDQLQGGGPDNAAPDRRDARNHERHGAAFGS